MDRKSLIFCLLFCIFLSLPAQKRHASYATDPSTSYAKDLRKVFANIAEGKIAKAEERYQKLQQESKTHQAKHPEYQNTFIEALAPLADVAEAFFLREKVTQNQEPAEKIWQAYVLVRPAMAGSIVTLEQSQQFLEKTRFDIQALYEDLERRVIDDTRQKNTESAYDQLISVMLQTSPNLETMKTEREAAAYREVCVAAKGASYSSAATSSLALCKRYLGKYTDAAFGGHIQSVQLMRDSLAFVVAPHNEVGMREYIQQYPDSRFVAEANVKMEDYAWRDVPATIADYRTFLKKYPQTRYKSSVLAGIDSLAYLNACAYNSLPAYVTYCNSYPRARQVADAKKAIARILKDYYINPERSLAEIQHFLANPVILDMQMDVPAIQTYYRRILQGEYSLLAMAGIEPNCIVTINDSYLYANGSTQSCSYSFGDFGLLRFAESSTDSRINYQFGVQTGQGLYLRQVSSYNSYRQYKPTFNEFGQLVRLDDEYCDEYEYVGEKPIARTSCILFEYADSSSVFCKIKREYLDTELVKVSKYDEEGRLKSEADPRNDIGVIYTYNAKGLMSEATKVVGKTVEERASFVYEFDAVGRWTQRDKIVNNKPVERIKRSYSLRSLDEPDPADLVFPVEDVVINLDRRP